MCEKTKKVKTGASINQEIADIMVIHQAFSILLANIFIDRTDLL